MAGRGERVAVSSTGPTVKDEVDPHFGRCAQFIIAEDGRTEVLVNAAKNSSEGAGLRAAQLMIDNGVTAVITGSVGPKAFDALSEAGIKVYTGCSGRVEDALAKCRGNELEETKGPTSSGHRGT